MRSETLQALFERTAAAMMFADDRRRFRDANPAACAALEMTRQEVLRLRIDDLTAPDHRARIPAIWAALQERGTLSGRIVLQPPSGKRMEIYYSATANIVPGLHLAVFPPPGAEVPVLDEVEEADEVEQAEEAKEGADGVESRGNPARGQELTPREREVITLLALGLSGAEIAERLVLSPETVRIHVRNARQRLGARTRAHAIALALESGAITL
jgi:PAS domain S-box-containing protein